MNSNSSDEKLLSLCEKPFHRLYTYIKNDRLLLFRSISYSFINKLLDLAPPVLVGWCVDIITSNPLPIIGTSYQTNIQSTALIMGILAVVIFGLESLFQWLFTTGFMQLSQNIQHKLRVDGYNSLQNREMNFFENHRLGASIAILGDDINQIERFITNVFNDIVQLAALFIFAGFILASSSLDLSLVSIAPIPLIVWGSLKFQRLLTPKYRSIRESVSDVNTRLENNISGISVIKSFNAEEYELSRLNEVSNQYREANVNAVKLSALFVPLIRMGVAIGFGAVIGLGIIWTIQGKITAGVFTLFCMMSQRILWPLTRLGTILDEVERCRASLARIFGLMDTPPKITDGDIAISPDKIKGSISINNLSFSYSHGHQAIFENFSMQIKPGQVIGVAGSTGAGKSTLIKLLLRYYEPHSGEIFIDSYNAKSLKLTSLRDAIALVSQDVYLFHGSIEENIAYGNLSKDQDRIRNAAKLAQLHDFIESLPEKYQTLVGERGIKLSGGQRQRLSIARAILKDAPILILDEATSSVDTETEKMIQDNLETFTSGRTAIIIAHRLSTIKTSDQIIVLGPGGIAEQGTHEQLLNNKGSYYDMWRVQSGN